MDADAVILDLATAGTADRAWVGGKAGVLGELATAGFPVLPGVVVTAGALDDPDGLHVMLADAARRLGVGRFVVRSSGAAEDLPDASYAGLYETYLNVTADGLGEADRLRFESDKATTAVTSTLGDIGWILAADEFDRTDEDDFTTSQLMLWREERRAIGELMREGGDEPRCISFNSFVDQYEDRFSSWFDTFASQLKSEAAETNRLAELQRVLTRLVSQLDVDQVLVQVDESGGITRPRWAQPSNQANPTAHTGRVGFADGDGSQTRLNG